MGILDNINEHLRKLPEAEQAEVLDFVSFLEEKSEKRARREMTDWGMLSLKSAMRGLEEEDEEASYTEEDIKEPYQ